MPCYTPSPIDEADATISFDYGSSALASQAKEKLDRVATVLKRYPKVPITVVGYLDSTEWRTDHRTNGLAKIRAREVAGYLMDNGIEARRIGVVARDWARLVRKNKDDADLRVVMVEVRDW